MKPKSQNRMVNGVAFLAAAGILVKVLGLICKIPLVHIIGEDGMGYFNSAYTIYNLFFMLSNAGLPVAISILVSEQVARGAVSNVGKVFSTVLIAVAMIGITGCAVLGAGAEKLAEFVGNEPASVCILVMAPVFFFVCIAGGLRGYFQGRSQLIPTGVSQLIEALMKAVLGVGLALYGVKRGYSLPICAALALLGIAIGSFLSMAYLLILSIKQRAWKESIAGRLSISARSILRRLLILAFPVTLGSLVLSLSNFIDLTVVMRGLQAMGLDSEAANRLYGNYTGLVIPLFNLPPVVIMPIAYAAIPAVTAARIEGNDSLIGRLAAGALKSASVITLPCVFGFLLLARPILMILFEKDPAWRAAPLLSVLAPAIFFVGIVTVTNSILQAAGKQFLPVLSMLFGGIAKLAVSLFLIPRYGIIGAPIGTLLCYVLIAVLNLYFTVRFCHLKLAFLAQFWSPLIAAFAAGLFGRTTYGVLADFIDVRISALVSIAVTCVIYFVLLILLHALDREEVAALPLPRVIVNWICRFISPKERNSSNEDREGIEKCAKIRL